VKKSGSPIPIDLSKSPAKELANQVNGLNEFFAGIAIEPSDSHFAFQRLFNQAERTDFDWNKGGRLYSLGPSYQQMKAADRLTMKLNGESVVEIDLRASHLTILHALLGIAFDTTTDPYEIPGLPREVAKSWVTMTLGHDRFHAKWSRGNKDKYRENSAGELQKDYPISSVRKDVIKALPVLADWPTCKVRWGDLQYIESCIVIETMETLASENIPALPVHDSIIVPKLSEARARNVLTEVFRRHTGVNPSLNTR
jgi:hypothetical protein